MPTREQMIEVLTDSKNLSVKEICNAIHKSGYSEYEINKHLKMCGSFMKCVLLGDFNSALAKADVYNKAKLQTLLKKGAANDLQDYLFFEVQIPINKGVVVNSIDTNGIKLTAHYLSKSYFALLNLVCDQHNMGYVCTYDNKGIKVLITKNSENEF